MAAYLEEGDLSGARVEARRLAVVARYLREREASRRPARATRSRSARCSRRSRSRRAATPTRRASGTKTPARSGSSAPRAHRRRPRRTTTARSCSSSAGRVPHRVARRVSIGEALTRASREIAPHDREQAGKLAAQGLVTWVAYPTLAERKAPRATIDGHAVALAPTCDVTAVVEAAWKAAEGRVLAAAPSRAMARVLVGKTIEAASHTRALVCARGFRVASLLALR